MAPGRELASQIFSVCEKLIHGTGLRSTMVIGGANALRQVDRFKKVKPQVGMERFDWLTGNAHRFSSDRSDVYRRFRQGSLVHDCCSEKECDRRKEEGVCVVVLY